MTAPLHSRFRLRGLGLRLFRVSLLVVVVWMLRGTGITLEPLRVDRVRDIFPSASSIDAEGDPQPVRDATNNVLGYVTQTMPAARDIIGYSGPTNVLIAMDANRSIIAVRILHSDDTPEHVAEVISKRSFFAQFKTLSSGAKAPLDAVTGATLTSTAITQSVMRKLGQGSASLRFPEPIKIDEVKAIEPKAAELRESKRQEIYEVLDAQKQIIAMALRTAPTADSIVGYKGPTDTLVLLDAQGEKVRGIRLRKSYDTKRYVGYVTGDDYFLKLFNGKSPDQLATLDFKEAKIEGVSGSTETSWAVAEGIKQRAQSMLNAESPWLALMKTVRWRWQDTGHLAVLISALMMAFTRLRGVAWLRVAHHALLVAYVGFVAGEMLSQALFAGWAKHGTPWRSAPGLVLIGLVALLAPVVTRRQLYCHHICPHGALQQLLMKRVRWQFTLPKWLEGLPLVLLGLVLLAVTFGLGLSLNGIEPFDAYLWKVAGVASLIIAGVGLLISLFVPMAYCRFGCPTGALFKLLRYAGAEDKFGRRDLICALLVGLLCAWRLFHA